MSGSASSLINSENLDAFRKFCFGPGPVEDSTESLVDNNAISLNPWMNSYISIFGFSQTSVFSFLLCIFQFTDFSFAACISIFLKLLSSSLHAKNNPASVSMFHIIHSMIELANIISFFFVTLAVQSVTQQE